MPATYKMANILQDEVTRSEVDDVLTCPRREAVTALKWLQLHVCARAVLLKQWSDNYAQLRELEEENDAIQTVKETTYYPLLLPFLQAAALGQDVVQFLKQNYSKPAPREDIVGMVLRVPECPTEVKLKQHVSLGGEDGGIKANIVAFAGLARCLSKVAGKTHTLLF